MTWEGRNEGGKWMLEMRGDMLEVGRALELPGKLL